MAVLGITGTSGKTTTTYFVRAGLLAAGPAVRPDRDRRDDDRRRGGQDRLHHPRGARAAGAAGGDARTRHRHGGDGGVQPRARARPRGRHRVRGRRVHQPLAGPSRLPSRHGRLLRGEGAAVRRPLALRGGVRRRRVGTPDGVGGRAGRRHRQHVRRRPTGPCATSAPTPPGTPRSGRSVPGSTSQPAALSRVRSTSRMPCWRWRSCTRAVSTPPWRPTPSRPRSCRVGWSASTPVSRSSRSSTTATSRSRCRARSPRCVR